jgi:hypothetical protein
MKSITDTERAAIEKEEISEYEQRELRGSGYALMHVRDRGYGTMRDANGKEVVLEWFIRDELREDGKPYRNLPPNHFAIKVGSEEVVLYKEVFQKIYRWT